MKRNMTNQISASKTPPPRDSVEPDAQAHHPSQTQQDGSPSNNRYEQGFTLQTLIILAIFVVLATVAGVVIVAITTSGNEDLEASGRTDIDAACAPNEIRNQDLESRGIKGNHSTITDITSNNIGCLPHCATWEYPSKGPNKEGEYEYDPSATSLKDAIGGPDGAGGVFSTNKGCFAPCYWRNFVEDSLNRPKGNRQPPARAIIAPHINGVNFVTNTISFDNSNRSPRTHEIRFGVVYAQDDQPRDLVNLSGTEVIFIHGFGGPNNGPHMTGRRHNVNGITAVGAYPNKPAWRVPNNHNRSLNLEVIADPVNETCTIVETTRNIILCSSEDENCAARGHDPTLLNS